MPLLVFTFYILFLWGGFTNESFAQKITLKCETTDCVKGGCVVGSSDTLVFDPSKNKTYDDLCRAWKDASGGETKIFEGPKYFEILCDDGKPKTGEGVRDVMSIKIDRYSGEATVRVWEGTMRMRGQLWYMKRMDCVSVDRKF